MKPESVVVVTFKVDCPYIANMRYIEFAQQVTYKRRKITHCMAKILQCNTQVVERLMPLQCQNGVIFSFLIDFDDVDACLIIEREIQQAVDDTSLAKVESSLYVIFA